MQTEKILAPTLSRPRHFNRDEQETWAEIMSTHRKKRKNQLHPIFLEGLELLEMDTNSIPDIQAVNKKLKNLVKEVFVVN